MTPLEQILRELGREHRRQSAPASIGEALTTEFRRRHRRRWMLWAAIPSAAAMATLAAMFLQPPPPATLALSVAAPPAPQVRFTPEPPPAATARPRNTQAVSRAIPKPVTRPEPAREIATDFFPLRPGPVLEPGELARVVRARIPRNELLRFGLAPGSGVSIAPLSHDVPADVVFGHDGTARAIRFVHYTQ